jgi:hypothetical protein
LSIGAILACAFAARSAQAALQASGDEFQALLHQGFDLHQQARRLSPLPTFR